MSVHSQVELPGASPMANTTEFFIESLQELGTGSPQLWPRSAKVKMPMFTEEVTRSRRDAVGRAVDIIELLRIEFLTNVKAKHVRNMTHDRYKQRVQAALVSASVPISAAIRGYEYDTESMYYPLKFALEYELPVALRSELRRQVINGVGGEHFELDGLLTRLDNQFGGMGKDAKGDSESIYKAAYGIGGEYPGLAQWPDAIVVHPHTAFGYLQRTKFYDPIIHRSASNPFQYDEIHKRLSVFGTEIVSDDHIPDPSLGGGKVHGVLGHFDKARLLLSDEVEVWTEARYGIPHASAQVWTALNLTHPNAFRVMTRNGDVPDA